MIISHDLSIIDSLKPEITKAETTLNSCVNPTEITIIKIEDINLSESIEVTTKIDEEQTDSAPREIKSVKYFINAFF